MSNLTVLPDGSVTCTGGQVILRPSIRWYSVEVGKAYSVANIVSTGGGTLSLILRIGHGTRGARVDDILTGMC